MKYGYKRKVNLKFDEAVSKIREELSKEELGVLTECNVAEKSKEK